jgi:hypothetical protein
VAYTLPAGYSPVCIAPGDYNNDGKVDLAVPLVSTDEVAVYLGNGDGTFQAPIITTATLPNGDTFADAGCAAADFNGDGKKDLAAWGGGAVYVLEGEGNGSFNATAYSVPATNGQFPQLFVGDYNGDGRADIATNGPGYGGSTSTVNVFYGNDDFTFNETTPITFTGYMEIGSGDLNSDGITDLYGIANNYSGTVQLGAFYGTKSDTFDSYWTDTPTFNYPQISMGYCPTRFGLKADTYGDLMVDAGLLSCRSDGAVQAKLRNELRAGSARS